MAIAGAPVNNHSLVVNFPVNYGTDDTPGNTVGIALTATKRITIDTLAPVIERVMFGDVKNIDVVFTEKVRQSTVLSGAFTLTTSAGGDDSAITSVTLQPDSKTVRVNSSGASIASTGSDTITVDNTILDLAGNANAMTGPTGIMGGFSPLVISEVQVSGGGAAAATDEFVEIYNRSGGTMELETAGLKLHIRNSAGVDENKVLAIGATKSIPSHGYFLIGAATDYDGSGPTAANATYDASSGNTITDDSSVYISWNATPNAAVIDKVGFGIQPAGGYEMSAVANITAHQSVERKAHSAATAASMVAADSGFGNEYDSDSNNFDFIVRTTSEPQNAASSVENPGGGAPNQAPNIMHAPLFKAVTGSDLTMIARIGDDGGTMSNSNTFLYYCGAGAGCDTEAEYTSVNGTDVGAGWFKFIVSSAALNATNDLRYFLAAKDNAGTPKMRVMTNDPNYDMNTFNTASSSPGNTTATKPILIDVVALALGDATVSGTVQASSTGLADATVFLEGTPFTATTGADGTFSMTNVMQGSFNLVVTKSSYIDSWKPGFMVGSSGTTAAGTISLSSGNVGSGGDYSKPTVMFTAPADNMNNAPKNIAINGAPILIAFSKAMDSTTVTDANILLKRISFDGSGTPTMNAVTVSVGYEAPGASLTVDTVPYNFGDDAKAVVYSATSLLENAQYVIEVRNVKDSAGNMIQGNRPNGDFGFMFSTAGTVTFGGGGGGETFGSGNGFPPFIFGTMPMPGIPNIPLNTKVLVKFSEAMDSSTITASNLKIVPVTNPFTPTQSEGAAIGLTSVSLDTSTKAIAILQPSSNLTSGAHYRIKVLGGVRSQKGITMAPPGQESSPMFMSDFDAGTATDSAAPTVNGTYPSNNATDVSVNIGGIKVSFSDNMDPSTITGSSVLLKYGSTAISTSLNYDPMERSAVLSPKAALTPGASYTISVTSAVKDMAGNSLAAAGYTGSFTVSSTADTQAPNVMLANADDFSLAITFTEPMNSVDAIESTFAASVKKLANYTVKSAMTPADPASGTVINLLALSPLPSIEYKSDGYTVVLKGLKDPTNWISGKSFYVEVNNVTDLSGNVISATAKSAKGTVQSMQNTGGMLGGGGPMISGSAATGFSASTMFDTGKFAGQGIAFVPAAKVFPFNSLPSQTTIFGIELPISSQIDAGGTIALTFPTGFNIAGAKKDTFSPPNNDINGPGTGSVVFATVEGALPDGGATGATADDGVYIVSSTNTVYVKLGAVPTNSGGHDYLRLDIAGIVNSSIPKDYTTSGYKVDIKTKNASGTLLESITSEPFFIQGGGTYTLRGTVTATLNDQAGTMKVYLGSPMTGPMETISADFSSGTTAIYSFANLPAGDYMLFTDQSITLGSKEFAGKSMPERIVINEAADLASNGGDNDIIDYNFTMASNTSGGIEVPISITGPANTALDVFAGSPSGFRVKQITLNGAGAGTTSLWLGDGQWSIGVGPQMPKGPMAGPPVMPTNYLPPRPKEVRVTDPNCTVDGAANAGCDTAISFALTSAGKTIKGIVKDGSTTPKVMSNAEVYAYSPTGGMGTHAQSDASGNFTLNVSDGSYVVGAFIPGMPSSKEASVIVNSNVSKGGHVTNYLYIDGAAGIDPDTAATTFILKVAKPDYTISGKVTDGTNVASGASVYAYRTDGPGHANANTDSSGNYTLYVSTGTWKVGVFLPQYGNLTETTVNISTSSVSNQNFSPSQTGTFYEVSGRVYKDVTVGGGFDGSDVALQGVFVRINGNGTFNETVTGTDGKYSFKVPTHATNTYTLKAFAPSIGELTSLAAFNVNGSAVSDKDFVVTPPNTVTFTLSESVTKAFIDAFSSTGTGNHLEINNGTTGTMSLSPGSYKININIPGMNIPLESIADTAGGATTAYDNATGVFVVDEDNEGLTITLPILRTVSGTVTDGTNNIENVWVEIGDPVSGVHFGAMTDTNGAFTLKVADSATAYFISAMKPRYFREPSSLTVNGGNPDAQILTLTVASRSISGQVKIGATGAANAFVRAEKQGGGFSGVQADANGYYILPISSGVWKVYGVAEGYAEVAYASNPVDASAASPVNIDITLSATVTLKTPKSKPITPATGGTFEDTNAGIKITIPANALGTSTSAGNIEVKETNNFKKPDSSEIIGGKAKEIKVTDSDGNPITTLNDNITIEMTYTKAELAATLSSDGTAIDTKAEADKLATSYQDATSGSWATSPSTVIYKNSSGAIITDPATIDTAGEFDSVVSAVVITTTTDHFSYYAPSSASDPTAPATPAGLAATANSTSQITLTWTASSGATGYDIYRSATSGGTYTRLGSEPTVGAVITYPDSGLTASTPYYYKITAINASGESAASIVVTATTNGSSGGGSSGSTSDTTPPTNISISIAAGATTATSTAVALTLAATGASHIMISNVADFSGSSWETYAASKAWTLTSGDGVKTVYAKFKDAAGNISTAISDTITLAVSLIPTPAPNATPTPTPVPNLPGPATPAAQSGVTLYRASGDNRVYVVKDGKKTWIKTAEEFKEKGYKWVDVIVTTSAVVSAYPDDTTPASASSVTLYRASGDNKVYAVKDGKKQWIKTAAEFVSKGYKWTDIVVTTPAIVASYPDGVIVAVAKVKIVDTPTLKVRKLNSTRSTVVGSVKLNEVFTVIEKNANWYKITLSNGVVGWISGNYTASVEESGSVVSSGAPMITITTSFLKIRSLNNIGSKVLGLAKKNEKYSVLEELAGWYKIQTSDGIIGWVSGAYAVKQ